MSAVTVLGSGRVGGALARGLAGAGHDVTIGTRDPARAREDWSGPAVVLTDPVTAVGRADVVVNATPGATSLERLSALCEQLEGSVLLDVSNATTHGADGLPGALVYPGSSLAEHLQASLPGTRVVKSLNTMLFTVMTDPRSLTVPPTAFLSGDDAGAKATVAALLGDLGWPPELVTDLGGITTARGPEAFALLVPHVIRARGFAPFALALAH